MQFQFNQVKEMKYVGLGYGVKIKGLGLGSQQAKLAIGRFWRIGLRQHTLEEVLTAMSE